MAYGCARNSTVKVRMFRFDFKNVIWNEWTREKFSDLQLYCTSPGSDFDEGWPHERLIIQRVEVFDMYSLVAYKSVLNRFASN